MPRGNKTGPNGDGPMTGRAQGYCTGNNQPGFINNQAYPGMGFGRGARGGYGRGMGRGYGRGMGQGFGFRHGYQNDYVENRSPVSEKTLIENEIRVLKDQLSYLEKQLSKPDND